MATNQQGNLFKVLSERLKDYLSRGDLGRAEQIGQTAVDAARRHADGHPEALPQLMEAMRALASVRISNEDHSGAALVYQEAFHLARGNQYVSARQIAFIKSELAGVLERVGRTEEAIPLYQDAVEIFESARINEPLLAANIRNNLAMIFKERGSLEMAEEHYLITLDVFDTTYGRETLEVASIYNNIGGLYQAAGHLDRALEMQLQALDLRKRLGDPESEDVGQSLCNVAAAYHGLGKYDKADHYYLEATRILSANRLADSEVYQVTQGNHQVLLEEMARQEDVDEEPERRRRRMRFVDLSHPVHAA